MRTLIPIFSVVALAACGPAYVSEQGQIQFDGGGMRNPGDGEDPNPLLDGGLVCTGTNDAISCFDERIEGGERVDAACIRAQSDTVEWSFLAHDACEIEGVDGDAVDDRVVYRTVDPADVTATVEPIEEADIDYVRIDDGGDLPTDWAWSPGQPVPIASDGEFAFDPTLRMRDDPDQLVQVAFTEVSFTVVDAVGAPSVTATSDARPLIRGVAGESGDVEMSALGETWGLNPFVIVDVGEAASLEVVAVGSEDADGHVTPLAARAVVRDAEGNVMFGAPVVWETEGAVQADPGIGNGLPGADYTLLSDSSQESGAESGSGTVTARLGDLSDTVELVWDPVDQGASCGCDDASDALLLLPLGAVIGWVRRRGRK